MSQSPAPEELWRIAVTLLPDLPHYGRVQLIQEMVQAIGPCPDSLGDTVRAALVTSPKTTIKDPVEKALLKLKKLLHSDDQEWAHSEADKVLCDLLQELGHKDVVEAFDKIDKWYA